MMRRMSDTPPPEPPPTPPSPWASRVALLLVLLAAATFLPTVAAGYCWDDNVLVVQNLLTGDLSTLPRIFAVDLWESTPLPDERSGFYRPLVLLSFAFDRAVAGLSPGFAHLHSVAWHLAAGGALWMLLRRMLHPTAAAVGLALFLLHPAQVEAVAWISARNDPMAAAFLFTGLLLLERDRPSAGALVGGAACMLAALLSKESALLAPVLLPALALARTGRPGRLTSWLALLAAFGIYAGLRLAADVPLPARADPAHLQAAAGPTLAFLARSALWPVDLLPGLHLAWPPPVPRLAVVAAVGLAALLLVFGRGRALAGLVFAGLTLAPAIGAVADQGLVADRYLYLPLAGLGLALGAALPPGRVALGAAVVIGVAGAMGASRQLPAWRDDLSLWTAALEVHPSPFVQGVLGRELELAGHPDEAAAWYRLAVQPPKPMHEACYRISAVHLTRGDPAAAVQDGQAALDAGCPATPELLGPMAVAQAGLGNWDDAEVMALELAPDPTGLSTIVAVAAGARRGNLGPLRVALAAHPDADPAGLYQQVAWLLSMSGEEAVAEQVRAAGRAAGHLPE